MFASSGTAYIVVFVLGVLGVTTEFRYQTITPTVLQTPSRWAIVTAKMITYAMRRRVYALVCVWSQLAVAVPWLSAKDIDVDFGNGHVPARAGRRVRRWSRCSASSGSASARCCATRSSPSSVGIIFLLVLENILLGDPGRASTSGPTRPAAAASAILHTTGSTEVVNGVHLLVRPGGGDRAAAVGVRPGDRRRRVHDEPRHHLTRVD